MSLNGLARLNTGGIAELFGVVEVQTLQPLSTDSDGLDPIVDLCIYFPSKGEHCPEYYYPLDKSVMGQKADLNRSYFGRNIRLAYRRSGAGPSRARGMSKGRRSYRGATCDVRRRRRTPHSARVVCGKAALVVVRAPS